MKRYRELLLVKFRGPMLWFLEGIGQILRSPGSNVSQFRPLSLFLDDTSNAYSPRTMKLYGKYLLANFRCLFVFGGDRGQNLVNFRIIFF